MLGPKFERQSHRLVLALGGSVLLLLFAWAVLFAAPQGRSGPQAGAQASSGVQDAPATPTPTSTPPVCPLPTPVPLWVDPVPATTNRLTETVVVYIGHGEAVTVSAESGVFVLEGDFDSYLNPARVEIALSPYVIHHLAVYGRVPGYEINGCVYESYVLSTNHDRYGAPLVIRQVGGSGSACYLPLVYR